jgi:hypothetical protein
MSRFIPVRPSIDGSGASDQPVCEVADFAPEANAAVEIGRSVRRFVCRKKRH